MPALQHAEWGQEVSFDLLNIWRVLYYWWAVWQIFYPTIFQDIFTMHNKYQQTKQPGWSFKTINSVFLVILCTFALLFLDFLQELWLQMLPASSQGLYSSCLSCFAAFCISSKMCFFKLYQIKSGKLPELHNLSILNRVWFLRITSICDYRALLPYL